MDTAVAALDELCELGATTARCAQALRCLKQAIAPRNLKLARLALLLDGRPVSTLSPSDIADLADAFGPKPPR